MRNKIIDYFMGEPEEINLSGELLFYAIMLSPIATAALFIFIARS